MPYQTDERLKNYLDTNQLHREQMCVAILSIDKRFSDVSPRHPRGGPDGGRDIEAIYRDEQLAYGAVGFVNQVNDSKEQKKSIEHKFRSDLTNAIAVEKSPDVFVFFTNINLTIGEKNNLISEAKEEGILFCEIFDRERLRIALDSTDGFLIRFQYLNIALSEEEQASFFARWGDDIQSVISTGFQRIENTLNRILFFHEASDILTHLTMSFELDKEYSAEEIGHFRLFCTLLLMEPKNNILSLLFGLSDKPNRMRSDLDTESNGQKAGIEFGIGGGQWEMHIAPNGGSLHEYIWGEERKYILTSSSSKIGRKTVDFLSLSYGTSSFIRPFPSLSLRDIDEATFVPLVNKSLAEKFKAIHIYSNGYKLQELDKSDFRIDDAESDPNLPVVFEREELLDPWVVVRPSNMSSAFQIRFFEETPKRLFVPTQTKNSLER